MTGRVARWGVRHGGVIGATAGGMTETGRPRLDLSVYVVTDSAAPRGPEAVAVAAARGGARA